MKKNIKKNKKDFLSVREISNDKEIRVMIWLLFAIGVVLWSCFEVINTENAVAPSVEVILNSKSTDDIIDKYKDDAYFKSAFKGYQGDIWALEGQMDVKDEDSNEYKDLAIQKEHLENSIIRYSLYDMKHHSLMVDTYIYILIASGICLVLFTISFLLVTFKKFKVFNIISFIEVLLVFIFEFIYGDFIKVITSMEFNMIQTVRFLALLFPILLNYLYSLYYKKDV